MRTRINTDLDVADSYLVGFLLLAVHTRDVCYNSWANEPVCSREARSHTKPALQEVNSRPCCAQQRVKGAAAPGPRKQTSAGQGLINQGLEFIVETRILAEMEIENRGKIYFPWGKKSTSMLFSMKIKMMDL